MSKFLSRWGRVFGRIFSHLAELRGKVNKGTKLLTWALAVLGAFVLLPADWAKLKPEWAKVAKVWLLSDNHWLSVLLGLVLLGTLLALYEVEKEQDEKGAIKLLSKDTNIRFLEGPLNDGTANLLIIRVIITFLNTTGESRYLCFPTLELQQAERHGLIKRWAPLPLTHYERQPMTPMNLIGLPKLHKMWFRDNYYELSNPTKRAGEFCIMVVPQGGAAAIIGRELRLKVGLEIIGQERPSTLVLPISVTGYTT